MMKQIITYITISIFIISCTTNEVQKEKSYSDSTEKEFNRIEKGLPDIKENSPTIKPVVNQNKFSIESHRDGQNSNGNGNDDRLNELNQNLNFYCMKSTRKKQFRNEKACNDFVQKSLKSCEKNHRIVNRALINCVKSKLHIK